MKALIVLDCQKGMLARGNFDLLRENILKLQEMFKASGDLIIHTRHIDENEESIIYNGDERGSLTKSFLPMRILSWKKTHQIFSKAKS